MEHGIVTTVKYESGVVYCDVRTTGTTSEKPGVPVLKPHSGFIQVPSQGDVVTIETLADGTPFITGMAAAESETPDQMKEGELAIQLDNGSRVAFKQNSEGNYDVHLESSGDVIINGVAFSEHTHAHDDSTISDTEDGSGSESTSEKQTTQPTSFTDG